jgi:EAL domain-containing protein (putative c-di-GMP-specific phosphodiesterase class I)
LQARGLYLEMHESELATAGQGLTTELDQLRAMGVGLAIDDFGNGLPSLDTLARLPVDTLKIDRSFIAASLDDPASAALVEAVAVAALTAGRHLIASGVESPSQLRWLRQLGYQSVQGHLIGAARPVDELYDVIHLRRVDIDRT